MRKKITDIIPPERLRVYRNLYDSIKKSQIDLKDFPYKEYVKIKTTLDKLVEKSCLSQDDSNYLQEEAYRRIFEKINFGLVAKHILIKRGAPRYDALDILIYSIIADLIYTTKKPKYELALDFLKEQDLITGAYSSDDLRKRFKGISFTEYRLKLRIIIVCANITPEKVFSGISPSFVFPDDLPLFQAFFVPETIPQNFTD